MDRKRLCDWVGGYERLWRSPGTEGLSALFSEDVSYSTGPFEREVRGLEALAGLWDEEREGPDEDFQMTSEIVAIDDDTGVVRVEVRYGPPKDQQYRDLWIVRLDDEGRCFHFEEWPHWPGHGTSPEDG